MGILLMLAVFIVVCVILCDIDECKWYGLLGTLGSVILSFALIVCVVLVIGEHACADKHYADLTAKKEVIEYRLNEIDNDENLLVNGGTYTDLIEYNESIRSYKTYSDSFWIGLFYSDKIAELDYIELPQSVS